MSNESPMQLSQTGGLGALIIKSIESWGKIPNVRKDHWKNRDTLTLPEFAFILKGKEPQIGLTRDMKLAKCSPEFRELLNDLSSLADSSLKAGALTELNPHSTYLHDSSYVQEFNQEKLLKWALSKGFDIPTWLTPKINDSIKVDIDKNKNTHTSELIEIMNKATIALWENHDIKKPPTLEMLKCWLTDQDIQLSANEIKSIDLIMRPYEHKGCKNKQIK